MMLGTQECVFRFGDVEVREREFRLIKAGEVVPVEPKAFRVLLFLLHNPQKLITKEELLNAVWGETAVSENSLTRSIALLRRLLGDDTHVPRYIETVAAVGYRFVCPVEGGEDTHGGLVSPSSGHVGNGSEASQISDGAASETVSAKSVGKMIWATRRRWLLAATVLTVGLLALAVWYVFRPLPPPKVTDFVQITHDNSRKWLAGTDGTRFFFGRWSAPPNILEVAISGGEVAPIPIVGLQPPGPWVLDVSPDGSTLLVYSPNSIGGGLWSVQILGGSLQHLTDGYGQFEENAAWSPDGKSVVYSKPTGGIYVVRSDGSDAHKLGSVKEVVGDLAWSPDGSLIRFTLHHRIWEMVSDGAGLHELPHGWHPSSWLRSGHWTPDGKLFEFSVWDVPLINYPNDAPYQLWVLDERRGLFRRTSTEPTQLTSGPIRWDRPYPSKDGKKIFDRGVILRGELVSCDLKSHQIQPYLGGIPAESLSFSPDGRFVAYVTFPDGILWKANRDGSSPMQLTRPPWYPFNPRWSPDSTQILFFASNSEGHSKAYVTSSLGGTPRPILPDDKESQSDPNWSPDGSRIVFASADAVIYWTRGPIRILDLASQKISTLPGSESVRSPRWSPDGRFIATLYGQHDGLKVFDIKTQRWSVLKKEEEDIQMNVEYPTWPRNGQFIYFLGNGGVSRIRLAGGDAERVVYLKGFRLRGAANLWMGLDPEDAPLLLRDIGRDDLYALTLETK